MHITRHATLSILAIATCVAMAACATFAGRNSVDRTVTLGPGGRAEGVFETTAGEDLSISLENGGPGIVVFVVRGKSGKELAHGPLDEAEIRVASTDAERLVVVFESDGNEGATVSYTLSSDNDVATEWDLSEAHGRSTSGPE